MSIRTSLVTPLSFLAFWWGYVRGPCARPRTRRAFPGSMDRARGSSVLRRPARRRSPRSRSSPKPRRQPRDVLGRDHDHTFGVADDDVARIDRDTAAADREVQIHRVQADRARWWCRLPVVGGKIQRLDIRCVAEAPSVTTPATPRAFKRPSMISPADAALNAPCTSITSTQPGGHSSIARRWTWSFSA